MYLKSYAGSKEICFLEFFLILSIHMNIVNFAFQGIFRKEF